MTATVVQFVQIGGEFQQVAEDRGGPTCENAGMTEPQIQRPSLADQLAAAWRGLTEAVTNGRHEWHLPVIASIGVDGRPEARTVVLRSVDPEARTLTFHTDRRSPKIREIEASGRLAWAFYERTSKTQVRASGITTVHADDDVADAGWARTTLSSRRCYLAPHPPSGDLEEWHPNLPDDLHASRPDSAASEAGRVNFALVRTRIDRLERLELHHDGHLRAAWRWNESGVVEAGWLAP
jgi:pyridoxamine 5'-phosphate oxidase